MAPRKETAVERSKRLAQESHFVAKKADSTLISKCMKEHPGCIPQLKRTLVNLNYLVADSEGQFTVTTAASAAAGPDVVGERLPKTSPSSKKQLLDLTMGVPPSMQHADGDLLGLLLEACEPVSLSTFAMKANLKPNQRKMPRNLYYELFEFIFDLDRDTDWAQAITVGALLEDLKATNVRNGRRAAGLAMPISWAQHGLYVLSVDDGVLTLRNRFTDQTALVHNAELATPQPSTTQDFCIMKNYSARCATLVRHGRLFTLPCCTMLPLMSASAGVSRGGALAIEGGRPALQDKSPDEHGAAVGADSAPDNASLPNRFQTPLSKKLKLRSSPAASIGGMGEAMASPLAASPSQPAPEVSVGGASGDHAGSDNKMFEGAASEEMLADLSSSQVS